MKLSALKVRTLCKDTATGAKGMITHVVILLDHSIHYVFGPAGLNEDGVPLDMKLLTAAQLSSKDYDDIEVPVEILGSTLTDDASGYTGTAIELWMHPNGCFHVMIQSKGRAKDGEMVKPKDFDIRQCSGAKLTKVSEAVKERSRKVSPSPAPMPARR